MDSWGAQSPVLIRVTGNRPTARAQGPRFGSVSLAKTSHSLATRAHAFPAGQG